MKQLLARWVPLFIGQGLNTMTLFSKHKGAKLGIDLFCKVRAGRIKPKQANYLDPAKYKVEEIGEHRIQTYHWPGDGPSVLLLHGWESNVFRWRNLIGFLQEANFNIYAFDAPGHGYSSGDRLYAPLYAEVSREVQNRYKPQHIVAHSMGGMATLYDHYERPESDIEKIVTIGSPCDFKEIMDQYQKTLRFNTRTYEAMDNYMKEWIGHHVDEFSSAIFVKDNKKKGLLFHDIEDRQISVEASRKVHKHWEGSHYVETKGLGHSMHQEGVNKQIISFLQNNES